jgi:RNA polymerase sigma-32 factor
VQREASVCTALKALSPRERFVVGRHVLSDEEDSYATIGGQMGLSRERVRQIEHAARNKLRAHLDAA